MGQCVKCRGACTCEVSVPAPGSILHVVWGNEDIYSSHAEWTVAAYLDREKALDHAQKAQEWHDKNCTEYLTSEDYDRTILDRTNPYDTYRNSSRGDREYEVFPLFVHFDVEQFRTEAATLADKARELGYLPP